MEALRWPDGHVCPHCGESACSFEIGGSKRSHRAGLHHCKSCRKQFSVTIGTVLERTRVSYVNWMRLASFLSTLSDGEYAVPEIARAISVSYKTVVGMLERLSVVLTTYKGLLSKKKFGKPISRYITKKARPPEPKIHYPAHPDDPGEKKRIRWRYVKWKERQQLDATATPEPRGVLASFDRTVPPENLDRVERLLMILLNADMKAVKAKRKLRREWPRHRQQIYKSRTRRPNRKAAIPRG
jgi:transposase-like protein